MFEEIMQQIGKVIDLIAKYGWNYWYISIPIFFIILWFIGKMIPRRNN